MSIEKTAKPKFGAMSSARVDPLVVCCICGCELVDSDFLELLCCEDCYYGNCNLESLLDKALDS